MAKNNREKLFAEFPPVSTEAWEAAIAVDRTIAPRISKALKL